MRRSLSLVTGLLAALLACSGASAAKELVTYDTVGAARDSIWEEGHAYRQWIYDQNFIGDDNSNLDPEISFLAGGMVRSHPSRVYFYNELEVAIRKAKDTGMPLACYLFDHTCRDCLFILPQLYREPAVVEASKDFVNCYVELPRQEREATANGLKATSLAVEFFLPGMRRLRVVSSPDEETLLQNFAEMKAYVDGLDEETKYLEPRSVSQPGSN